MLRNGAYPIPWYPYGFELSPEFRYIELLYAICHGYKFDCVDCPSNSNWISKWNVYEPFEQLRMILFAILHFSAYKKNGDWLFVTYKEYLQLVRAAAKSLIRV